MLHATVHPQLAIPLDFVAELIDAGVKSARQTAAEAARRRRPRRGERARLACILGLPRQRLTEFLRTRRQLPDAERTLMLLVWLHVRRQGRDLG